IFPFKNEQQIEEGYFFVLKGVLLYVVEVGKRERDKNGKVNARLRCIFENGTESDMLLRSLAAELYKNGRRVTENENNLLNEFMNITDKDEEVGYIYVVKSMSTDERIRSIQNLFKIGYSKTDIQERIKNAEKEPTYLMAPVKIEIAWKCFNMNPQKLEQLLHNFFGNSCLELDVFDEKGKRHTPREWFIAPIEIIEQVIKLIIDGGIVNYKFDAENLTIVSK
ncbi:MAG: GIY-YIG nuclease family protein, partial [Spirochaetes bacterium]|nr:GIY-YIG nuclease family protein [Spirochaetota bacterium]